MIDNSLKSADDVGEHRRPRYLPYRETQRSLDYGSVVTSLVRRRGRARSRGLFRGIRHLHSSAQDELAHLAFLSKKRRFQGLATYAVLNNKIAITGVKFVPHRRDQSRLPAPDFGKWPSPCAYA